jgi:hypothetical protein
MAKSPGQVVNSHIFRAAIVKVVCKRPTDRFLEGSTDEVGYRSGVFWLSGSGKSKWKHGMKICAKPVFLKSVNAKFSKKMNHTLFRLKRWVAKHKSSKYEFNRFHLAFYDRDWAPMSPEELIGRVTFIRRNDGSTLLRAGRGAHWDGEKFHLTGSGSRYWIWFQLDPI